MLKRLTLALLVGSLLGLAGCYDKTSDTSSTDGSNEGGTEVVRDPDNTKLFRERLLQIAGEYKSYQQVDRDPRWAPVYCAAPPSPVKIRFSAASDSRGHGRKLYFVFAKEAFQVRGQGVLISYSDFRGGKIPLGQAVVKESWIPEEVTEKQPLRDQELHAKRDGRTYRAGKQGDLFIIYKTDPATAGTDNGWVYGTVTPDGKTVTSAGRVANCMKCHEDAPHERLFGLPEEQEPPKKASEQPK